MSASIAAVDLGAASGRVMRATVDRSTLDLTEVARFANVPVRVGGTLHWDVLAIFRGVLDGLRAAGPVDSVGVDSWAVDYGLIDGSGMLLGNPVCYRDSRTDGILDRLPLPREEIYAATGIQFLPFNTAYQLMAERLAGARTVLLLPDLITYWLTGVVGAERTNASSTQLLDVRSGQWATSLMSKFGLDPGMFPALREPGSTVGGLLPDVAAEAGQLPSTRVVAVGSHDTASAVVGVPADSERFAYISCGTWSLVGVELDRPVLTPESLAANFTNEVGVDGTIRYLRNVMGLWLLQESLRTWGDVDLDTVLAEAAREPAFGAVVPADDPTFLPPGDMPARIAEVCSRYGQTPPTTPAGVVRCIVDSLALAHRAAVLDAQRLSGREVDVIHIVGGGSRNELLCQLTADACGLPVVAGPAEATALGNVLVQARALGLVGPDLAALRALVRATQPVRRYEPRGDQRPWADAAARLHQ